MAEAQHFLPEFQKSRTRLRTLELLAFLEFNQGRNPFGLGTSVNL